MSSQDSTFPLHLAPRDASSTDDADESPRLAAQAARRAGAAQNARRWLLQSPSATLCTIAAKRDVEGYPFGSVVPYALDAAGRPLIFLADMAAHTANLRHDPRATLFIQHPAPEGDPQKHWRVGVLGDMRRIAIDQPSSSSKEERTCSVSGAEYADIAARYVERVPSALEYATTHSFCFWRMERVAKIRYIAGFGEICWLDGGEVLRPAMSAETARAMEHAVEHMNQDHRMNLIEMCRGLYGQDVDDARMLGMDTTGFDVETSGPRARYRFSFHEEAGEEDVRGAVIAVLKRARTVAPRGAA